MAESVQMAGWSFFAAYDAAEGENASDVIDLPSADPLDLTKATMTSGSIKDADGVKQFDSVNPGSTATFKLNNTKADVFYSVSLGAATANTGNQLNLKITDDATGIVEMDKTFDITPDGWQTFNTYKATTNKMSAGQKTFVITFIHNGSYTSNVNNIIFTEVEAGSQCFLAVNVNPSGAGKVTVSPEKDLFDPNTAVTLTQQANKGFNFVNWTDANGNALGTDDTYSFTITENTTVNANYAEIELLNKIPTSAENPFDMTIGELHGSRASYGADNHIDWMNNGDYVIYKLDNTVDAQYYDIEFGVGTQNDNVSITVSLANEVGETIWSGTSNVENNGNWNDYKPYTLRTGELNKGKYIMTLTFNSVGGNGTTGNLNNIKLTAKEKFVSETVDNQTATITYAFNQGVDGQTAVYSDNAANWFKNNYSAYGSTFTLKGARLNQTLFQPANSNEAGPTDENYIDFMFAPVNGLTFTPTKISFNTSKFGTGGGMVDATWVNSDGTTVTIQQGIDPMRNDEVLAFSKEVTGAAASSGVCGLRLNLYSLGNNKQVGFGNIVIEGIVTGATQDVPQYALNVKVSEEGAGVIDVKPNATTFSEGDNVTLTVTENFGYHFAAWVDANGTEVSTENPYTFAMTADTDLTATFTKKNVYALNYTAIDDMGNKYKNVNLVTFSPVGNLVDGVHYYEEGTDVKVTVANNKILSFTGWEDGTTNAERTINMDGEKNVTVNYAVADYIVAWDLYQDQPASQRAADYCSNSENAGLLSLRNAAGETIGWLSRGVNNGAEEGRWGARIWKLRSEGWYWEISFSTKGYSNIKFSNGFGHSYNTYKVMKAQYSVDGTNFTDVGTYDIVDRGWVDGEFTLPAEANNQERVYIRWVPGSEELVGSETDYDGLSIGDIFVFGESEQANDQTAPVLVSSNPANGATGASATGSIVLTFDERIKAGTGSATLNGENIAPTVTGKTAVFQYAGLDYNKEYAFTIPAGVITDRSGNAYAGTTINFTTMERTQPAARIYDAVVAADGSGDYKTVQEAIDAAPAGRGTPWLVFIKAGEYKEHVNIPANKPYIHLIGQDDDKVFITDDRLCGGDNAVHVDDGATVVVKAGNCFFEGITFVNSWGHEKQAGPQALALNTQGDRIVFNKCSMWSYQDTWITTSTSNNRCYAKDCFIEGAVDFIYNSGNYYFENSTLYINRKSGGYIVAPSHAADVKWGYVFMNTLITAPGNPAETDVWLGRPWHNSPKTVFINTTAEVTIPAAGWYETMGGLPALWAEYNTMDGDGNPVDLSQRRSSYYRTENNEKVWVHNVKNTLTAEEAAQYTVKNVLSGSDAWQPEIITEACAAPKATFNAETGKISWDAVPYAICYVITKDGKVVGFTTETSYDYVAGSEYKIQAANEFGGLSEIAVPGESTGIEILEGNATGIEQVYTIDGKRLPSMQRGINIVRTADGRVIKIVK